MSGTQPSIKKQPITTKQSDNQPIRRFTRLTKTEIDKTIEKGEYDDALREVKLIKANDHWLQCKLAEINAKMKNYKQSFEICRLILEKGQQCSECKKLFNSLSQKLQKGQPVQHLGVVESNSNLRRNTLRSAQQNSSKSTELPSNKSQFQQFLHFLRTNNCQFKNIQIVEVSPGHRVVQAKQDIDKDEVVIKVPEKLMITVQLAKASKVGKEIESIMNQLRSPKHSLLSLFLLFEEEKGKKSPFYFYLQILPKNLDNFPIFYPESLQNELKNTFFAHILERKKSDLEEDYAKLQEKSEFARRISYDSFLRARMIVSSRIFGIIINGNKTDALVPLADMLNHGVPKMTTWAYEDEDSAFIIRNIDGMIQKGEQIHDSYGCKCNSRFLLNYGFIQPNNPYNQVGIKLRDKENKVVSRMVRLTKDLSSPEFDNLLGYSRLIIGNVLNQNRKQAKNDDDIQELSPEFSTIQSQIQMWKYIESQIAQQISFYPTTIKTDQKILKQKSIEYNYRKCIQIRLGEKQVLSFYLNMARTMITLLSGKGMSLPVSQYKYYLRKIPYQRNIKASD